MASIVATMRMTSSLLGCCARPFSSTSMPFKLSIPYPFFGLGKSFQAHLATNHSMAMMNKKKRVEISHDNSRQRLIVSNVSFDIQCGHPLTRVWYYVECVEYFGFVKILALPFKLYILTRVVLLILFSFLNIFSSVLRCQTIQSMLLFLMCVDV